MSIFTESSAVVIVALGSVGTVCYMARRMSEDSRKMATDALSEMRLLLTSALVERGVHPHVADPERFGPTGLFRADEDRAKQEVLDAQQRSAEEAAVAQDALREAEAAALREAESEHFARMEQRGGVNGLRASPQHPHP
jgi:hypothetical protein